MQSAMDGVDFQAIRDMSQEERTKAMADIRTKIDPVNKKFDTQLEKILDATQMKRLKQLRTQRMGAAAFSNTEIVTALALTDEQKTKVKEIVAAARPQGGAAAFNPDATAEERQAARAKMQETQAKALKDIVALLTADQAKTWADMTGPAFKFPQGRGRGPGN
jgi:Spy/CpxP family protein refolding chaperone